MSIYDFNSYLHGTMPFKFNKEVKDIVVKINNNDFDFSQKNIQKIIDEYREESAIYIALVRNPNVSKDLVVKLMEMAAYVGLSDSKIFIAALKRPDTNKNIYDVASKCLSMNTLENYIVFHNDETRDDYALSQNALKYIMNDVVNGVFTSPKFANAIAFIEDKDFIDRFMSDNVIKYSNKKHFMSEIATPEQEEIIYSAIASNMYMPNDVREKAFEICHNQDYIYRATKKMAEEMYIELADICFPKDDSANFVTMPHYDRMLFNACSDIISLECKGMLSDAIKKDLIGRISNREKNKANTDRFSMLDLLGVVLMNSNKEILDYAYKNLKRQSIVNIILDCDNTSDEIKVDVRSKAVKKVQSQLKLKSPCIIANSTMQRLIVSDTPFSDAEYNTLLNTYDVRMFRYISKCETTPFPVIDKIIENPKIDVLSRSLAILNKNMRNNQLTGVDFEHATTMFKNLFYISSDYIEKFIISKDKSTFACDDMRLIEIPNKDTLDAVLKSMREMEEKLFETSPDEVLHSRFEAMNEAFRKCYDYHLTRESISTYTMEDAKSVMDECCLKLYKLSDCEYDVYVAMDKFADEYNKAQKRYDEVKKAEMQKEKNEEERQ